MDAASVEYVYAYKQGSGVGLKLCCYPWISSPIPGLLWMYFTVDLCTSKVKICTRRMQVPTEVSHTNPGR